MRLYHFTSPRHVRGCLQEGLRKGVILQSDNPPRFKSGWQWLTKNGGFIQEWAEVDSLPYDRTAYRLTIELPKIAHHKAKKWIDVCHRLTSPEMCRVLNGRGRPGDWYVFKGLVRPRWIVDVTAKHEMTLGDEPLT